jgi:hypothetical protein
MWSTRAYAIWIHRITISIVALLVLSCGRGSSPDHERSTSVTLGELTALAAPLPSVVARLRPTNRGWETRGGVVRSPGTGSTSLVAELPAASDGELRIGAGKSAAQQTRWRLDGASSAPLELDQGRAVYSAALPSTDLIVTAEEQSLEILLLLRDEAAPTSFRFAVDLAPGLVRAEPELSGGVAFVDARGDKRLRVGTAVAVDAAGTVRNGSVRWSDGALTLALDTRGLVYPIALDPVVNTIAWRRVIPNLARFGHAMAYDAANDKVVVFGGSTGDAEPSSDDTWTWDSAAGWTPLSPPTRPSPRSGHVMAYDSTRMRVVLFGGTSGNGELLDDTWEWDGITWTEAQPSQWPMRLRGAAMAGGAGKVLLFGGQVDEESDGGPLSHSLNHTWTWDGSEWKNQTDPQNSPPARHGHAMAFDEANGWVVMFGGEDDYPSYYNDVWTWKDGQGWTQPAIAGNPPPPRAGHAMADVPGQGVAMAGGGEDYNVWRLGDFSVGWQSGSLPSDVVYPTEWAPSAMARTKSGALLFGGNPYMQPDGRAWTTTDGLEWTNYSPMPPSSPGSRRGAVMAYDSTSKPPQLLLVGGQGGLSYDDLVDTWAWDGGRWSFLSNNGPAPRANYRLAPYAEGVLLFGGYESQSYLDDTWLWKGGAWQEQAPSVRPFGRSDYGLATNVGGAGVVLFGGSDEGGVLGDTWVWDGANWLEMGGLGPPASHGHAMAYDAGRNEVVLFGGSTIEQPVTLFGDTWIWNGTTWKQAPPGLGPHARVDAVMAYDSVRKKVVLTGGSQGGEGTLYGDTWEWDGATWSEAPDVSYSPRGFHAMGYDEVRQQMVLFGGMPYEGTTGDTWVYESFMTWPDGLACSDAADCVSGFCVGGVCCNVACDSVCFACSPQQGSTAANGVCAPVTAGSPCDDGDLCTSNGACTLQGQCVGEATVCMAQDACHEAGACDPSTGKCSNPACVDCPAECTGLPSCGNDVREGDEVCDGADLMAAGADVAPTCADQGEGPGTLGCKLDCSGFDVSQCACPPTTNPCRNPVRMEDGLCKSVSKWDGAPCPGGECVAGQCIADPPPPDPHQGTGSGAGSGTGSGGHASEGAGGASSKGADDAETRANGCTLSAPDGGANHTRGAWFFAVALSAFVLRPRRAA